MAYSENAALEHHSSDALKWKFEWLNTYSFKLSDTVIYRDVCNIAAHENLFHIFIQFYFFVYTFTKHKHGIEM